MSAKKKRGVTAPGRCRHFLERSDCPLCNGRTAYVTRGGRTFHLERACEALAAGQTKVAERGHTPDPIQVVKVNSPLIDHRLPCKVCFPESYAAKPRPLSSRPEEGQTGSSKSPPKRSQKKATQAKQTKKAKKKLDARRDVERGVSKAMRGTRDTASILRVGHGPRGASYAPARPRRFQHDGLAHSLTYVDIDARMARWRCACGAELKVEHRGQEDAGEWYALESHRRAVTGGRRSTGSRAPRAPVPRALPPDPNREARLIVSSGRAAKAAPPGRGPGTPPSDATGPPQGRRTRPS